MEGMPFLGVGTLSKTSTLLGVTSDTPIPLFIRVPSTSTDTRGIDHPSAGPARGGCSDDMSNAMVGRGRFGASIGKRGGV